MGCRSLTRWIPHSTLPLWAREAYREGEPHCKHFSWSASFDYRLTTVKPAAERGMIT